MKSVYFVKGVIDDFRGEVLLGVFDNYDAAKTLFERAVGGIYASFLEAYGEIMTDIDVSDFFKDSEELEVDIDGIKWSFSNYGDGVERLPKTVEQSKEIIDCMERCATFTMYREEDFDDECEEYIEEEQLPFVYFGCVPVQEKFEEDKYMSF